MTRNIRRAAAVSACALLLAAQSTAAQGGSSTISAVAADVVGVAVAPDGSVSGTSGTVPMSVTREQVGEAVVITVTPGLIQSR
jgi:hypothetical protein